MRLRTRSAVSRAQCLCRVSCADMSPNRFAIAAVKTAELAALQAALPSGCKNRGRRLHHDAATNRVTADAHGRNAGIDIQLRHLARV